MNCCAVILAIAAMATSNELSIARSALRDGLWEIARAHATAAGDGDEARRIVLESLAREGKWADVAASLKAWGNPSGGAFDYYSAAAEGNREKARRALEASGTAEGILAAKMIEADVLSSTGRKGEAEVIWHEVAAMTNVEERAFVVACVNLGDAALLRKACATAKSADLKRMAGLGLGVALSASTNATEAADGERIVREIVKDSPDAQGAREAFLSVAESAEASGRWKEAADIYRDAVEIWPDTSKTYRLQSGRGWAMLKLGKREDALEAFVRAEELAEDDTSRATAVLKQGDVLCEMGRGDDSMAKYNMVMEKFPDTSVAKRLKRIVKIRALESSGREHYRNYRFAEAQKAFATVAAEDPSRADRMEYYRVLCLFGQGLDEQAATLARKIVSDFRSGPVRAAATLWLAKFSYNRGSWKESRDLFKSYVDGNPESPDAPAALLWEARAAFSENDFIGAVQIVTSLAERYPAAPEKAAGLTLQGEALIELSRFDEAVLVLELAALGEGVPAEERMRASVLKADALYAMGADNPARYQAALEAYRAVRFGGALSPSAQLSVSFKIARTLEKLRRNDEAMDQYYTQVVLPYRNGRLAGERYDDDARAAFSRAAFHLADEYESRGGDSQALNILNLVAESDVPAAAEAQKRIERISTKGRFL